MIYAVIPTQNRPTEYQAVIDWCMSQGITPITITTSDEADAYAVGIRFRDDVLNISRWWNIGLDEAYRLHSEHVFVLNDDVVLPDHWAEQVVQALDAGYVGASGIRGNGHIQGYAFALNGSKHIRADEGLVWWFGDDDIQRQCEQAGGFALIPGMDVENYYANSTYMRFREQINLDRLKYVEKWGAYDN